MPMVPAMAGRARLIKGPLSVERRGAPLIPARPAVRPGPPPLRVDLEQAGGALAAADAHGHHAPAGTPAVALLEDVAGAAGAGHAEGVPHGDRPAVDVVPVVVDAEAIAGVEALAGEGLVELPKVDLVDLQTVALEEAGHG